MPTLSGITRLRKNAQVEPLEQEAYEVVSRWYYLAINELASCEDFREDYDWIAGRMLPPISPEEARQAIRVLIEHGVLERSEDGALVRSREVSTGTPDYGKRARTSIHRQLIAKGSDALEVMKRKDRWVFGITLALNRESFALVRERIANLRDEVIAIGNAEKSPEEVVQLNLQFFHLTKPQR